MGILVAYLAYLLAVVCYVGAFLLFAEWLVHLWPGPAMNYARRILFQLSFPLLKFSDLFFSLKGKYFNSRGLLTALALIAFCRFGVPWLVILSYSLKH
jgi:hypothetical protein